MSNESEERVGHGGEAGPVSRDGPPTPMVLFQEQP